MMLKDAKDFVWLNLWSLEFHRLKQTQDQVVIAMGQLNRTPIEINKALDEFDTRAAKLASSYANEGLLALCNIAPTVSENSNEANILAVRTGLPEEADLVE